MGVRITPRSRRAFVEPSRAREQTARGFRLTSPTALPFILFAAVLNGLTTGAVYALVALGLTLIYGVLHIINFAHGAALMVALYAAFFACKRLGIDPYLAALGLTPLFASAMRCSAVIGPAATARTATSCS